MIYHFIIAEFFDAYDELTPMFVHHSLDLEERNITSLGQLTRVSGSLFLRRTEITSLGDLEWVGYSLYLENAQIYSLGKLQYVGDYIWCDKGEQYDKLKAKNYFRFKIRSKR